MKAKPQKNRNTFSLPAIFREVKHTVSVYLNEEGIAAMSDTPYLRDHAYIACSRIIDDAGSHYLQVQVRYYKADLNIPQYVYAAVPHAFVKYMTSESPFHENSGSPTKFRKIKKN